ncbi:hypothetical protein NXF25_007062 [Crotalus adamanteus]|uniref:Uncharacterized protein n=1 Tax=Crotalus adamanteus TaxID=8729 RepID=A0AAW1C3L0_CROAD
MNLNCDLIWRKLNTWNAASRQMLKWCQVTGILCDPKNTLPLKSKIYHMVVHPVALYGLGCWPMMKRHRHCLQ